MLANAPQLEQALLEFAHNSGIFAFMHSPWGWPTVESLHYLGLCLLLGTVGVFDLRMLGMGRGINYQQLHRLVPVGVLGYLINVFTGTLFVVSAPDQYLYNPAWQSKIILMLLAGLNLLLFYTTMAKLVHKTPADSTVPGPARIMAGISLASWCAVIVAGRLITYYRPPYHWCWWC